MIVQPIDWFLVVWFVFAAACAGYMKFHEKMWAKMKKNKSGMVDIKDMEMMHAGMMKDGTMMQDKAGKYFKLP